MRDDLNDDDMPAERLHAWLLGLAGAPISLASAVLLFRLAGHTVANGVEIRKQTVPALLDRALTLPAGSLERARAEGHAEGMLHAAAQLEEELAAMVGLLDEIPAYPDQIIGRTDGS